MHSKTDAQQHEAARSEAEKADLEEETEEEAAQKGAQKRYLLTLLTPGRQAEVVFARAGMTLPEAVKAEVVEFEMEEDGTFHCALRRAVTVAGVTFEPVLDGRLEAGRAVNLQGVRTAEGPVAQLASTRAGLQAVTQAGVRPLGPVVPPRRPS